MVAAPIRDETRRLVMRKVYDAVVKWTDVFGGCYLCHKCGGAPRDLCLLLRAHLIANLTSTCPPLGVARGSKQPLLGPSK